MATTTTPYTWVGLLISYLTLPLTGYIFRTLYGEQLTDGVFILKELINLAMVGVLLWIILKKERLGLDSIGLQRQSWKSGVLWTVVAFALTIGAMLAALSLVRYLGLPFGTSTAFDKLSAFSITLVCVRAGIAEEIFMRGYQLERWHQIVSNKYIASALSLIPFALFHFTQGWAGIIISFAAGAAFTLFYWWKKNLTANIIAHFAIDFMANIGR